MKKQVVLLVIGAAWISFWFWAFSFSYSASFFRYNPHSRLPTFLSALFSVCAVPGSAFLAWRQVVGSKRGSVAALAAHFMTTCAVLALPFGVSFILSRASRPWRLEADDAMGVGINNLVLLLVAIISVVVLGISFGVRHARTSRVRAGSA